MPYHLRLAGLIGHRAELTARRIILTRMSAEVLGEPELPFEAACDGYAIHL